MNLTKAQLKAARSYFSRELGRIKTPAKAAAARRNGLLGGRPRVRPPSGYGVSVIRQMKTGEELLELLHSGDPDRLDQAMAFRSRRKAQAWIDQEEAEEAAHGPSFMASEAGPPFYQVVEIGGEVYRLAAKKTFGVESPPVKEIR